jgi:hypothetical protein
VGDEVNPLDKLLNTSVPKAPRSKKEAQERLESLSRSRRGLGSDEPRETESRAPTPPPVAEPTGDSQARSPSGRSTSRPAPPPAAPVTGSGTGLAQDLWELDALFQHASELQKTLEGIDSAMPERSEATDRSGAVRVVLGTEGLPETFRVATDWNRRIDPRSLGEAVVEACEAAMQQRLAAWAQVLEDQGLMERIRRIDRLEAQTSAAAGLSDDSLPPALQRKPVRPQTPPLEMLADKAMSAQDALDAYLASSAGAPPREPQGTGTDRTRALRLTVTESGTVSCDIDPKWAARRPGPQVAEALNNVLGFARRDLAKAVEAAPSSVPGVDIAALTEMIADAGLVTFRPPRNR